MNLPLKRAIYSDSISHLQPIVKPIKIVELSGLGSGVEVNHGDFSAVSSVLKEHFKLNQK